MIDNPNRNIRKHYNKYQISKYFNGKVYYYGTFHKLEDARKVRDVLEEVNWGLPPLDMKHIQKKPGNARTSRIAACITMVPEAVTLLLMIGMLIIYDKD